MPLFPRHIDIFCNIEFAADILQASLCGHYEVVQFLLEAGALCERDTFQGERCLYNALNNRIRNLLLEYDYSKSTDPLQPLASHITTLLTRQTPKTSDICLSAGSEQWNLHKFILSARSPYFSKKLESAPETAVCKSITFMFSVSSSGNTSRILCHMQ